MMFFFGVFGFFSISFTVVLFLFLIYWGKGYRLRFVFSEFISYLIYIINVWKYGLMINYGIIGGEGLRFFFFGCIYDCRGSVG